MRWIEEHGKIIAEYGWIAIGCIITALAINIFLVPFRIAPGGVTGLATVVYHLSNGLFPVGMVMFAFNIPLFAIGSKLIGRKFLVRTLFATFMLSAVIDATARSSDNFIRNYLAVEGMNEYNPDLILYSLTGGVLMGVGLGTVFRFGATTGGTDLAARITNRFIPHLTVGQALLMIDSAVIIFASVVFNSLRIGLYAVVTVFITSKVIDAIIEGINFAKALFIISDKSEKIAQRILTELNRGVTSLKGAGMYTGKEKNVLFCVVHRAQIPLLKQIVKSEDEKAFIILTDVREVLGEGFGQ